MQLKTMILLSSLLLAQTAVMPVSAFCNAPSSMEVQRRRHRADIKQQQHRHSRSASPIISGYVEDDVLFLSFSLPLMNTQLRVVDGETGKTVFEGLVSGNSLSISLEQDSENFEVYIN
ncbi:hypothetical protein [Bacteroides sp.]